MKKFMVLAAFVLFCQSCAYLNKSAEKFYQPVNSHVSNAIYPQNKGNKIFFRFNNLTIHNSPYLNHSVFKKLEEKFTVVENIEEADGVLEVNLLYAGDTNKFSIKHVLSQGYGDKIEHQISSNLAEDEKSRYGKLGSLLATKLFNVTQGVQYTKDYLVIADVHFAEKYNGWQNHYFRLVTTSEDSNVKFDTMQFKMFNSAAKKIAQVIALDLRKKTYS